ncbi:hypothetical protein NQ315_003001 [Exocentrus adspersus]|uniref:Uncharacterized protein n=1 Tax=Exocentrus adspersus TaxID=1586481 RepID=A0AAV8W492_9CUCU|nr:hypothetical protein NQ315_003001 [Exocentrus adspersus]
MLEKLLEENEYVTVFFYEVNSEESKTIMEKLENIDSEIDNFDIIFAKMADPICARMGHHQYFHHRLFKAPSSQHIQITTFGSRCLWSG